MTTPDEATPDETTPDETTPDKATPDTTTPDTTTPDRATPDRSTGTGRRRLGVAGWLAVLAAIGLGGYERWWVSSHTIGTLTSDGAVIGLMAVHLLHHGELPAYMWGQAYGGSLEMLLTALVFAVAGIGTGPLLATTALTSAIAAFAMWRAARRLVGERAALIGALALWVWPALLLWRSLKPGGTYIVGLAVAWIAVGYLVRVKQGEHARRVLVVAGVFCGLSFWSSPMTLQLLVPTLLWCYPTLKVLGRRCYELLVGAVVGAIPALAFGVTHHFSNLAPPGGGGFFQGFGLRFVQFFQLEVPIAASLRVEGSLAWVAGPVGVVLALALAAGFAAVAVAVLRHRAPRCELPVLTLSILPVIYTLNSLANHVGQGRYVLVGSSMGAVLVGVGLDNATSAVSRWHAARLERAAARTATARAGTSRTAARVATRAAPIWIAGLGLLGWLGVAAMHDQPGPALAEFSVGGVPMPANDTALRELLVAHHVHDAIAGYWIAYRVTFEMNESVDVTPISPGRFGPIRDAVFDSPHPAYLFVTRSVTTGNLIRWCAHEHVATQVWRRGAFTVVQPETKVLPAELPKGVLSNPGPWHPANA